MKINKILATFAISLSFSMSAMAENTEVQFQATSTLNSVCTVSATNVSFGALSAPLNSQPSTGNMEVLCNKGTPYTIELAYGGVYSGSTVNGTLNYTSAYYNNFYFQCSYGGNINGQSYTTTTISYSPCPTTTNYSLTKTYEYGKMIGTAKGDSIAYAIYLPNDPAKVWNKGVNSYTSTGTGALESISLSSKIVPEQSGVQYPTPDMYMDTVVATVTY